MKVQCQICKIHFEESTANPGFPRAHVCIPISAMRKEKIVKDYHSLEDILKFNIRLQMLITQREGMVAENMQREGCGESMAYLGSDFTDVENEMKQILIDMEK